ncbi:MAG: hypothetical protein ACOY93_17520 [Bacillota bacterium]
MHRWGLRQVVLLFWAAYFAVVGLTNILDLLHGLGLLPAGWRYLAGNLPLMIRLFAGVGLPAGAAGAALAGVVLWEGAAAWLFWRTLRRDEPPERACALGAGLWAAFLVADELLLSYSLEAVHLRLFTAQLLSWLVLRQTAWHDPPVIRKPPHPRGM